MALYHCPFCPFSDDDSSFLMNHVGLSHPETEDSPFIAHDDREDVQPGQGSEELAGAKGAPSDGGYIECECGETVLLSEFSSHSDFHMAEGIALDDAGNVEQDTGTTILSHDQPIYVGADLLTPINASSEFSPTPAQDLTAGSRPCRLLNRDAYIIKDRANVLLDPTPHTPRAKTTKTKHRDARRLGKSDLGPHAYEDQMPKWLRRQLEKGAKVTTTNKISADGRLIRYESIANETRGVLPVLSQLCEQDQYLSKVYLCHPDVQHVVKMEKEGGFCGYRNIQMMISYIQGAKSVGSEHFPGRIPSILELQNLIERAWDLGFNSAGKIETGGVRGTRKFIGTPEAQAVMRSLNIPCDADAFNARGTDDSNEKPPPVHHQLYRHVERYFSNGAMDTSRKVCQTSLPPIYFQHPGHSLTIVGLETRKSGTTNLLVFDPMFKTSPGILRLIGTRFRAASPEMLLKAYRRGDTGLKKHNCFEVLKLTSPAPARAGWE